MPEEKESFINTEILPANGLRNMKLMDLSIPYMNVGEGLSMAIDSNNKPSFYFNEDKRVPYLYDVDNSLVVDLLTDFEGINVPLDYDFSLVYSTLASYGISVFFWSQENTLP